MGAVLALMVESVTVMVPALLEIPPPTKALPRVTVTSASVTGKVAESVKVVPVFSPFSTL